MNGKKMEFIDRIGKLEAARWGAAGTGSLATLVLTWRIFKPVPLKIFATVLAGYVGWSAVTLSYRTYYLLKP